MRHEVIHLPLLFEVGVVDEHRQLGESVFQAPPHMQRAVPHDVGAPSIELINGEIFLCFGNRSPANAIQDQFAPDLIISG